MEALLRRVIWFVVDRPRLAAALAGAAGVAVYAALAARRRAVTAAAPRIAALHVAAASASASSSASARSTAAVATALAASPFPSAAASAALRAAVDDAFARATAAGALRPLASAEELRIDVSAGAGAGAGAEPVHFVVSILDSAVVAQKNAVSPANLISRGAPRWPPADAFSDLAAPGDDGGHSVVCELAGGHVVLLNKFPLRARHCVLTSRRFKRQSRPLDAGDLAALLMLVRGVGGVGFYNCGFLSGASQPRRHTQFVPYASLADVGGRAPLDAVVEARAVQLAREGAPPRAPFALPLYSAFPHLVALVDGLGDAEVFAAYRALLERLLPFAVARGAREAAATAAASAGAGAGAGEAAEEAETDSFDEAMRDEGAHNVLLTPRWLLVVPRARDSEKLPDGAGGSVSVDVNALGFSGLMLARANVKAAIVRSGPLAVLKGVVVR